MSADVEKTQTTKNYCFVCSTESTKVFKLNEKKVSEEGFNNKLKYLLQDSSVFTLLQKNASVCRNCYKKITDCYIFKTRLNESCAAYNSKRKHDEGIQPPTKYLKSEEGSIEGAVGGAGVGCGGDAADHTYGKEKNRRTCSESDDVSLLTQFFMASQSPEDRPLLDQLRWQAASLTTRSDGSASVLYKYRDIENLSEKADILLNELVKEMAERVPLLLEVMCSVAVPVNGKVSKSLVPVLASAYSLLMKHKFHNLSAFHRLTTTIVTRGVLRTCFTFVNGLEGGYYLLAQTRLNHLGLTLSSERRTRLQDSAEDSSRRLIIDNLHINPLIKITGDNLDIYVKTSHMSTEKRNKDLHLFTSNVIFSRCAQIDMDNTVPSIKVSNFSSRDVLLNFNQQQKQNLIHAYGILVTRTLCQLPSFKKYTRLFPLHIPHEFSEKMTRQSLVFPLPIMFKNEAKHEDCLVIMDTYEEELKQLYNGAFGDIDFLRKFKVPVGGDQLTRVRLQEAKNLRTLSATPEKRFDDLYPIVCELWHMKQDFLEKCFKALYKNINTPGTLRFFKTILHRDNVNGKVKGRFQPHLELMLAVGEGMITEQLLEYLGMDELDSQPKDSAIRHLSPDTTEDQQKEAIRCLIHQFLQVNGYGEIGNKKESAPQSSLEHQENGPDELYNYSVQLVHWYLHIIEMNDTAKEGDIRRAVLNSKYAIPFFFSHSKLSKYMVENIDYVLKCEFMLSPLQRMRVLEGSFVNVKGGRGNNVESDLVQEHSVCNQKSLIKLLGANKSEKAISRVTGSADTIADICAKFDESLQIKPKSTRHSKSVSLTDKEVIQRQLRQLRPFRYTPGRKCSGFQNIQAVPLKDCDIPALNTRINQIIFRLTRGLFVTVDGNDSDNDDSADE